MSLGLCTSCYKRRWRRGLLPKRAQPWSSIAAACVSCGETDRKHRGHGLCRRCYSAAYATTEAGAKILREGFRRYRQSERGRAVTAAANRRFRAKPLNAEKDRIHSRRQRESKYGILQKIPLGYEALVLRIFGDRCASCGRPGDIGALVLDHHRPLREGHALLHNAVPLCRSCNVKKNRKAPEDFYAPGKLAEIAKQLAAVRKAFLKEFGGSELR